MYVGSLNSYGGGQQSLYLINKYTKNVRLQYTSKFTLYRVIYKSVKHFKNSQQIDYATDHGNSYVDREREKLLKFFFKENPAQIVALICR